MKTPSMTRAAVCSLTLLGAACASAPAPVPAKAPPASSSSAAATATGPATAITLPPNLPPLKVDTKIPVTYDRVALIWGFPSCLVRPWVVTVVDLGSRTVTFRGLASSSELPLYLPSPTGEACFKGPCPTMAVEMAPPSSSGPSLYSGTGTMGSGSGKGLYALPGGTSCPEPPMLSDGELVDLAVRLVAGRNDAAAARGGAR